MSEDFPQHHIVDLNDNIRINGKWYKITRPETNPLASPFLAELSRQQQDIPEYVQNNIRDLNYFLVMLTDLANIYGEHPTEKNAQFVADQFANIMATVLGYQKLDLASRNLATALRHTGHTPNFIPEEDVDEQT